MFSVRKTSFETNFYSKPVLGCRDTEYRQPKTKRFSVLQDIYRTRLSEKEFYEKVKDWIEMSTDRFGYTLGKILEVINERDLSAFQLFKILMNSKLKTRLKLIIYEDEKNFYPQFWKTIAVQKDAVKIEGLKLLGYLTSEYIQNISQQTQIDCIKNLKKLSGIQINNYNVVRLSLNCIGNILTHSKYKIVDENQEIFFNVYEVLKNLNSSQKLEDHNNVRTLAALLRVLNCLHLEMKTLPQSVCEFIVAQLNKYLYLGTHFFPLPNSCFMSQNDCSLETLMSTSSSEISETEEFEDKRKKEEVCSKIRNYCAACLSNVFRQNPKLISQYLTTLLSSKTIETEVAKLFENNKEPLLLSTLEYSQKLKKKEVCLEQLKEEFNEASLFYLLLFEENNKVRLSVCKAISAILDGYHNEKLFMSFDCEKIEKTPCKSPAEQIYQIFKNLASTVVIAVLLEDDEPFFNHLLRLTATMLSHHSYEKTGHFTIQIIIKNILSKVVLCYQYHTIFLNCISCFSALASGNFREKKFEELALNENFNIVKILFKNSKEALDAMLYGKETKPWKQDGIAESTILLESIIALLKFPKHYVDYIIENSETLISILEKLRNFDKKFVNVIFKLVEETMKYITNNRNDSEGDDHGHDSFDSLENTPRNQVQMHYDSQVKVQRFHLALEKLLKQILSNVHDENIEFALNILYYLEESHWESYYHESKQKLLAQVFKLNNFQALKQSLLRLLGKICVFSHFIKMENFSKLIYSVFTINYPEKNNNIMIKNSWVLANLCANLKNFDVFNLEQNQEILSMILGYCNSSKEKLVSNGFRALGYFISNNTDQTLTKVTQLQNRKTEDVNRGLSEVYLKQFDSFSVKVCWNVCVSLSNILKSYKPKFINVFFSDPILQNVSQILTTKNNFKTQIHCIEMLALAYEKFPENPCFAKLPKDLIKIYFIADEENFDASELRYLPHLKHSANDLLIKLLKNLNFDEDSECLMEMINSSPHKLLKIFSENLNEMYNNSERTKDCSPSKESRQECNQSPQRKVESDHKLQISIEKLNSDENKIFKDYLSKVRDLSSKLVSIIDSSDEIRVSFAVYESLQQLAEICIESKEQYLMLELHNI